MLATASAQVCVPLGHSSLYFGIVIQCNLKWTAHVDQTILAVVYNQIRTTNKSRYFILKFAAAVTKGVKQFSIRA